MEENNIWCNEEWEAAYYLSNIAGIGSKSIFRLLEKTQSAREAMLLSEENIGEILDKRAAKAFLHGRKNIKDIISPVKLKAEKGIDFIPYTSPEYPERLRKIPDPPFGLYVKGKLPAEHKPSVAIIGARACSEYGKCVAEHFGKQLGTAGIQIISGMARGIDGIAQRGAIEGGGETYAVLGCGADVCYPQENRQLYRDLPKHGGIISEYLPGTEARSALFPPRNRIISGLADLLLVVEARKRSGTYITVMQALEQGKEVFAVPGRIIDTLSEGCNYLLTQGAGVAMTPEVIIEELSRKNYEIMQPNNSHFGNTAIKEDTNKACFAGNNHESMLNQAIMSALDITPVGIDDIYNKLKDSCGISMAELLLELTKMQIAGKIKGEGNYYRLAYDL